MIKFQNILLLLAFLAGFSSCQKQSSSPTPAPDVDITNARGGGDSVGGGSTINKKPLEAYAKTADQLPAYKSVVVPLLEKIELNYPRLAADFIHISQRRTWYFIPVALDSIASQIGAHSRTDQAALQDLGAVWFDSTIYDSMLEPDQGMLLVHELVMGARLLNFKSRQDRCFAKAALKLFKADADGYRNEINICRQTYPVSDDFGAPKFSPGQIDYDVIRKIVIELSKEAPDFNEVSHLIEDNGVRDYND